MGEFLNIKIFDSFIVQKSLLPNVSQDFFIELQSRKSYNENDEIICYMEERRI